MFFLLMLHNQSPLLTMVWIVHRILRVIFSEYRESEDTHEKSIFLLFHQNIPLGELIQGKIV